MNEDIIIVDGHIHSFQTIDAAHKVINAFNRMYEIEFSNPGTGDIEDIMNTMERSGIDYSVLANFTTLRFLEQNNDWTLEACKRIPQFIPLVSVHPDLEEKEHLLYRYIREGAKGIKIHPMAQGFTPNDEKLYSIYEICEKQSLPVVFHCGRVANARTNGFADLVEIIPIIEKYSKLPIVLTHMADGSVEDCLQISQMHANVFFDTSIIVTGYPELIKTNGPSWLDDKMVRDVFEKIGYDRIIFGSDYPWGSMIHDVERFLKMGLSRDALKGILGGNAIKLYNISIK